MESNFLEKKNVSTHNIDREREKFFPFQLIFFTTPEKEEEEKKRLFLFRFLSLLFVDFIRRQLNILKGI
jgi:hypothetical protein